MSSEKNFRQYRPPESRWQAFLKSFKKKKTIYTPTLKQGEINPRINPFKRPEKPKRKLFSLKIKLLLLLALILSWVVLAIYLPYFRINQITYYGLRIIKKEEIDSYIKDNYLNNWKIIPLNNFFIARTAKIQELLSQKYALNELSVRKKFPHNLEVDLEEKMSSVIYDNGEKYFLLDSEGSALKFLRETGQQMPTSTLSASSTFNHKPDYMKMKNEFGDYPVIYDARFIPVEEKQNNILSKKIIITMIEWRNMVEKEGIATIKYFTTDNPTAGLTAVTNKGFAILWQPDSDLAVQLVNLKTVLRSEKPNEYIDLRFGERVYWK